VRTLALIAALTVLFLAPCLAADPPLNVRDFGAKGDGVTDDTPAIRAAFEAAQKRVISWQPVAGQCYVNSLPELFFPNGRYKLSAPITPTCHLRGEGNAVLEQADPNVDIITMQWCWRWRISGFTFLGGRNHLAIGNNNIDTGRIVIENCVFQNASGCAIKTGDQSFSTQLTVSNCVLYSCRQTLINYCDLAKIADTWISTAPAMKDQAVIENYGGLLLENICGVPMFDGNNDPRWIDNYAGVTCRNVRFGGEAGGFCAVVNKVHYAYKYPVIPSYIILDNCNVYCINNPKRRCAIYLEEVPNQIIVRDCVGFPDLPIVKVDGKLDLATYFKDAATRGEACLRFFIDPAQVELRLRELPEAMRKYEVGSRQ
jgi:hypothetical protein